MKTDSQFGVCLIRQGQEAGQAAIPHKTGTLAKIVDWDKLPDGMLGIMAVGGDRFVIESTSIGRNQLLQAVVRVLHEPESEPLPSDLEVLPRVLKQVIAEAGPIYDSLPRDFDNSNWLGYRLAEILPLDPMVRQKLLEKDDTIGRLREIHSSIEIYLEQESQT